MAFDTNYGRLILENSAAYAGTVSGFADTDSIVLKNLGASTASLIGGALVLSSGGAVRRTLSLDVGSLDYSGAVFAVSSAGGDTAITVTGAQPAACYRAGTRIGTARGPVRVEDLRVGDRVKARFAHMAPVTWIGHRRVDCRRHPDPARVWPVRIAAHAFGPSLPRADLWLSPDHALFLEDALIPVKQLINGVTIARMPAAAVVYYHLELPEHDVVLAEGLEAESYLENGDRHSFDNAGGAISLHPAFGAWRREGLGCAPLVMTGPALDAARARVAAGAALLARGKPDRRRRGGGSGRSGSF